MQLKGLAVGLECEDYLNDKVATIDTRWAGHSVVDYLPSIGVLAGGMLLHSLLGHLSAVSAADEARANIASSKITFTGARITI